MSNNTINNNTEKKRTKIYGIFAMDSNGAIGIDNKLPFNLKDDLKHFKSVTENNCIVMGKNTLLSLPGYLPNREHIVLSNTLEAKDNLVIFNNIKSLMDYLNTSYENAFIIGGASVIHQFMDLNLIDELIITHVDCTIKNADVTIDLEKLKLYEWEFYESKLFEQNERNEYAFDIRNYIKKRKRFY